MKALLHHCRFGYWSSIALFGIGVLYAFVLGVGIAITGFDEPIRGPVLAVMEALTLLSAPLLVMLFAAIHASAAPEVRASSLAAFGFAVLAAGLTAAVHFIGLTALRQLGKPGVEWPSPLYAAELLSWDVFLGLALLLAAPAFNTGAQGYAVRNALLATGILCLLGTVGPVVGNMRLQFLGVAGYGVLLPLTSLLLARHFRAASSELSTARE